LYGFRHHCAWIRHHGLSRSEWDLSLPVGHLSVRHLSLSVRHLSLSIWHLSLTARRLCLSARGSVCRLITTGLRKLQRGESERRTATGTAKSKQPVLTTGYRDDTDRQQIQQPQPLHD
jgi:hypothetical protein